MSSEPALHRTDIHAPASSQELSSPRKARERLVHSGAAAKMQQHLGVHRRSLRECARPLENGFSQSFHGLPTVRSIFLLLTLFKRDYPRIEAKQQG
jgi:hypothetical protein